MNAIVEEPSLLDVLEAMLPIKRRVEVEGWPRPVWVWRLEVSQLSELSETRLLEDGPRGAAELSIELLTMCLGDEAAPGVFRSARGRSWLRRQFEAFGRLLPVALEFNGLDKADLKTQPVK